jgi:hypothetical protein
MKFTVGQIVRCVNSDHEHVYSGALYEIKNIHGDSMVDIYPLLESNVPESVKKGNKHFRGFFASRFESLT